MRPVLQRPHNQDQRIYQVTHAAAGGEHRTIKQMWTIIAVIIIVSARIKCIVYSLVNRLAVRKMVNAFGLLCSTATKQPTQAQCHSMDNIRLCLV